MDKHPRKKPRKQEPDASIELGLYTASAQSEAARRELDVARLRELHDHRAADRVFDCRTDRTRGYPCSRRTECFSCATWKALTQYSVKLKRDLLQLQEPQEFRFSLPVPRDGLANGIKEIRALLRRLRTWTAWEHVTAEVGMIHIGKLKDGWWNLHVHVFAESLVPLDNKQVRRAWKAITSPEKRAAWRKRSGVKDAMRTGALRCGDGVRSLAATAVYLTRPHKFAPGTDVIANANFDVLRRALKGKHLIISRGLDGRGGGRKLAPVVPTDKVLSIVLPLRPARMAGGILASIRRSERTSDTGLVIEKLCQSALWPLRGDRWCRLAEILDAAEHQLACHLIAFDANSAELVYCDKARLFAENGEGWTMAGRMLRRPSAVRRERAFTFVLHGDSNEFPLPSAPADEDHSQVGFVEYAFAELTRFTADAAPATVLEALCAIHRITEPDTPHQDSPTWKDIVAAKRTEVLPTLERVFGIWLVACAPQNRMVFYGGETIDWFNDRNGVAA